ncbi:MAG TPA: DegT/DnrJ/EryC1/StrS family aminotransferase [Luteibaculaceae bacterium]|nr:DegT/DnrJ/EryC1/StrS family aminotransferase [Luteibaculaceae bacterium]
MSNIPFLSFETTNIWIKAQMNEAFDRVFDSGWYILGKEVKEFETAYAKLTGSRYAVGLSNGLDALHVALHILGVKEGDEVIVPSNTYIATALAVTFVGAKPVFVEPKLTSYNIDPFNIESSITQKTKAIIPVHLYGQACDMQTIMSISEKFSLSVIEDNAQAHLAAWKGRTTGSWGHVNATSFYPGKNLGALGDAGAITTDSEDFYHAASIFRNYGSSKKYHNQIVGHNMRLDELQAAFLSVKLNYLRDWTQERQRIASHYIAKLQGCGDLILPEIENGATHVFHLFVIRTQQRDGLQSFLASHGIGTLIHYPIPPHLQPALSYLGYCKGHFPIAEELADTSLSLPIWPGMTLEMVEEVARRIQEFYG